MNPGETVDREQCYFLYYMGPDGKVIFPRDVDQNVQLFTLERVQRESKNRVCQYDKVGFRAVQ